MTASLGAPVCRLEPPAAPPPPAPSPPPSSDAILARPPGVPAVWPSWRARSTHCPIVHEPRLATGQTGPAAARFLNPTIYVFGLVALGR